MSSDGVLIEILTNGDSFPKACVTLRVSNSLAFDDSVGYT